MTKISKLVSNSIHASKAKDEKVTLFLNKSTENVSYKDEEGNIIEVGANTQALQSYMLSTNSAISTITPLTAIVIVTSAELSNWGSDGEQNIILLAPPSNYELISLYVKKVGSVTQGFLDNSEISSSAWFPFSSSIFNDVDQLYKYAVLPGISGGGGISFNDYVGINSDPIFITNSALVEDAGDCELTFYFEYKLVDIS